MEFCLTFYIVFFGHFNLDNMEVIVQYLKSVSGKEMGVIKCPRLLNLGKVIAMAICPIIAHFVTWHAH